MRPPMASSRAPSNPPSRAHRVMVSSPFTVHRHGDGLAGSIEAMYVVEADLEEPGPVGLRGRLGAGGERCGADGKGDGQEQRHRAESYPGLPRDDPDGLDAPTRLPPPLIARGRKRDPESGGGNRYTPVTALMASRAALTRWST